MSEKNQEAVAFLQSLNIKSTLFQGLDRLDVFETLKKLSMIYENALARERSAYGAEIANLQAQLQEAIRIKDENVQAKNRLEEQLSETRAGGYGGGTHVQQRHQMDTERQLIFEAAERERQSIIAEAQETAASIRRQAEIEVLRKKSTIAGDMVALRAEKENIWSELSLIQEQISQILHRRVCDPSLSATALRGLENE